jgi:hypothetical protein
LTLAVIDLVLRRDADALLLFLWILGTFLFATFLNWSITARTFLPMGPPVAILTLCYLDRCRNIRHLGYISLTAAAVLSIFVAIADHQLASCARNAARIYRGRYCTEADRVRFLGHRGFQYYMEQWGAQALDRKNTGIAHGDVIISPFSDKSSTRFSTGEIARRDDMSFKVFPFLTTIGLGAGGGFYSSLHGPVPWIINRIPPERYSAVKVRE